MTNFRKGIFIPLLFWGILTPGSTWLDLKISNLFYHEETFMSHPFWDWLYHYGTWPAWSMIILAFIGLAVSCFNSYRSWRNPSLFLILTLLIGSGFIIHTVLKDHWGRPRPRQIIEFGGSQPFRPYYQPNVWHQPEPSKSFSCGHCSMGFYFFALAYLGTFYQQRNLYWLGMGLAWGLGGLLSIARIAQGGHFLSDTLASALIMWLTAYGLAYFLLTPLQKGR